MTQTIINLGTGGAALNGQNGSTTGADSNDALFLDWPGDNAGNYLYSAGGATLANIDHDAAFNITGSMDIRVHVALEAYSSNTVLCGRFGSTSSIAWDFETRGGSLLRFNWTTDGTTGTITTVDSSVGHSFADNEAAWLRATFIPDTGAGQYEVKFFTSTDGETWTQLGATRTGASTANMASITQAFQFSGRGSASSIALGNWYRVTWFDGIDGTKVLDVDTSVITSGAATSFTAATGQIVTISRSTAGRKSVAVVSPVWLFGTDDYIRVANNALLNFNATDDFTLVSVFRLWDNFVSFGRLISKEGTDPRYALAKSSTGSTMQAVIDDGVTLVAPNGRTVVSGNLHVLFMVVDRTAQTITMFMDKDTSGTQSSISAVGSLVNSNPLLIGAGTAYIDMENFSSAVFRRTLAFDERAALVDYYEGKIN